MVGPTGLAGRERTGIVRAVLYLGARGIWELFIHRSMDAGGAPGMQDGATRADLRTMGPGAKRDEVGGDRDQDLKCRFFLSYSQAQSRNTRYVSANSHAQSSTRLEMAAPSSSMIRTRRGSSGS